ncbi:hypothetical protein Tco_1262421 [Tanacetum coccineum]
MRHSILRNLLLHQAMIVLEHYINYLSKSGMPLPVLHPTHTFLETPENPFIAPATIRVIESFMQNVGYQGIVDRYPRFTKLIIANLMKKFPSIPQRLEEDYHSIKDDIPLVSVYSTGNVLFCGMLILYAFLTDKIRATNDYAEYETVFVKKKRKQIAGETSSIRKSLKVTIRQKKQSTTTIPPLDDDQERDDMAEATLLSLTLHKTALAAEAQKNVAKVQEKLEDAEIEKMVEGEEDEESYASEFVDSMLNDDNDDSGTRIEPRSHKEHPENVDDDDETVKEKKDDKMMIKRQIRQEKATNDLIKGNLKRVMADTIIQERDALQAEMKYNLQDQATDPTLWNVLKRKFEKYSTTTTSCRDDAFRPHHHDGHQEDHAPSDGEKRTKRHKTSKSLKSSKSTRSSSSKQPASTYVFECQHQQQDWDAWIEPQVMDGDEVIPEDTTLELIDEFQNIDKHIPTIYDYARMMDTLNDVMGNQFKDAEEYVRKEFKTFNKEARLSIQHWKDSWHKRRYKLNQRRVRDNPEEYFSNNRILEVIRITTDQQHGLDYMEQIIVMRENDKLDSFSKADFKYLNKNDIEDLYYLCLNKKVNFYGIKNRKLPDQGKLNHHTNTFLGIEAHDPYSIMDKPNMGLIYLKGKEDKRVIYLAEIVKFYDATLKRVLNEVKLKIFKSEPLKKPPLLGELDSDIMKEYEREITKRLRHRMQMRRRESFVNGRPILSVMRRP